VPVNSHLTFRIAARRAPSPSPLKSGDGRRCDGESGFVLVATLWFVALLAFVAVIVAGWMSRTLERTHLLQQRAEARTAEIDAMNRVAYLMISNYFSQRGLEVLSGRDLTSAGEAVLEGVTTATGAPYIALDDRPYRFGDIVIRLQDDRGLYNLNFPDRNSLGNLLRAYGVPYDARDGLTDKLLDYLDRNENFSRLNGATRQDYARVGRPPPRNGPLLTPWESYRVLGWDRYRSLWHGTTPLPQIVSLSSEATGVNPNTASAKVLSTIPGLGEAAIARLLQYRARYLIENYGDLELATGEVLPIVLGQFFFFPANSLRLTLASAHDPEVHLLALRLTPLGPTPLRIDYAVALPQSGADRILLAREDLPPLPSPALSLVSQILK
jgi:DNA uptake protein ComE-like DNA-binding protein